MMNFFKQYWQLSFIFLSNAYFLIVSFFFVDANFFVFTISFIEIFILFVCISLFKKQKKITKEKEELEQKIKEIVKEKKEKEEQQYKERLEDLEKIENLEKESKEDKSAIFNYRSQLERNKKEKEKEKEERKSYILLIGEVKGFNIKNFIKEQKDKDIYINYFDNKSINLVEMTIKQNNKYKYFITGQIHHHNNAGLGKNPITYLTKEYKLKHLGANPKEVLNERKLKKCLEELG